MSSETRVHTNPNGTTVIVPASTIIGSIVELGDGESRNMSNPNTECANCGLPVE